MSKRYNLGKRRKPDGMDQTLPSGQTCRIRTEVSYKEMIREGIIHKDGLAGEFPEYEPDTKVTIDKSKPVGEQIDLHMDELDVQHLIAQLTRSPESMERLWALITRIAQYTVLEPRLATPPPLDSDPRDPDLIYADYVQLEDRAFLFNYALGGSDNVEGFASELNGRGDNG